MFRRTLFAFGFALTVGALALAAAAPPKAPPKPAPAAVRPAATQTLTLPDGSPIAITYHNGAVLKAVAVQTVFLGDWKSNQTLRGQLNGAVDTIVGGAYMDALSGYGVGRGVHDSTVDLPQTFVNKTMTDSDLEKLLPGWVGGPLKPQDANRLYLFFIPPGVTVTPNAVNPDFGYHAWFSNGSRPFVYAVINTSGPLDGATSVTSHEIAEAATDPTGQGYYCDPLQFEGEVADFTDGPTIGGKQYPYLGANLNGVNVQLVLDAHGNVINVPGAKPDVSANLKPHRAGAGATPSRPR